MQLVKSSLKEEGVYLSLQNNTLFYYHSMKYLQGITEESSSLGPIYCTHRTGFLGIIEIGK